LINRGPIEAMQFKTFTFKEIEFPRLINRGPIEAAHRRGNR